MTRRRASSISARCQHRPSGVGEDRNLATLAILTAAVLAPSTGPPGSVRIATRETPPGQDERRPSTGPPGSVRIATFRPPPTATS